MPLCGHCLPVHRPETQHVLKQLLGKADSHSTQQKGLPRHSGRGRGEAGGRLPTDQNQRKHGQKGLAVWRTRESEREPM